MKEKGEPQEVTCHICGYSWTTRSIMFFASCSKCGAKVRIRTAPGEAGE